LPAKWHALDHDTTKFDGVEHHENRKAIRCPV
jgi:hypothetical protein